MNKMAYLISKSLFGFALCPELDLGGVIDFELRNVSTLFVNVIISLFNLLFSFFNTKL